MKWLNAVIQLELKFPWATGQKWARSPCCGRLRKRKKSWIGRQIPYHTIFSEF